MERGIIYSASFSTTGYETYILLIFSMRSICSSKLRARLSGTSVITAIETSSNFTFCHYSHLEDKLLLPLQISFPGLKKEDLYKGVAY